MSWLKIGQKSGVESFFACNPTTQKVDHFIQIAPPQELKELNLYYNNISEQSELLKLCENTRLEKIELRYLRLSL